MIGLITDRQQSDVLLANAKGRYGFEDLNRVESAVDLLRQELEKLDVFLCLTVKTDWGAPQDFFPEDWPVAGQMARYLENIQAVAGALGLAPDLPETMDNLDHTGANNIELALQQAYGRLQGILNTYQFSGELYAGEENIL